MDAELWPSDTKSGVQFWGRKRAKHVESDQSGESQPRQRRRRRVIMSSSSEAEAEANESGSEGAEQSAKSSEWCDLRNDEDPTWDWDDERDSEELREFFSVCLIDPRSGRDHAEFFAPQAVLQHGQSHGQSRAPVAATTAATAGPSVQDASISAASMSATSALPTLATPCAAVRETTPFPQGPAVELPPQLPTTSTPQVPDPILAAAHYFHGLGVVTVTHDLREERLLNGQVRKFPCRLGSPKSWKEASYVGLDGTRRSYEWDHEILPNRSNLRAVPGWLISILNEIDEATSEDGGGGGGGEAQTAAFGPPRPVEEPQQPPPAAAQSCNYYQSLVCRTGQLVYRSCIFVHYKRLTCWQQSS
eukprot:TRINITY_DN948_c0_g5_i1.p1 TRINITY_DN948_c0_g5~~TRINITY_DN948_c0_g5_i1.p1  ORF type:complete len:361 (+),score=41.42 TRINITY_DN948_c0_g5_i1:751-1833(+)